MDSIYAIYNLEDHPSDTPTVITRDFDMRLGSEVGDTILDLRAYTDRNLRWAGIDPVEWQYYLHDAAATHL